MRILSHRGYWHSHKEENGEVAFKRSFEEGFGVELDVRDLCGALVISHDPPTSRSVRFERFLEIYKMYDSKPMLAINIKADGLQPLLGNLIHRNSITHYFVFDMPIPDALLYLKHDLKVYMRQSEYERAVLFYDQISGVWMDSFVDDWISEKAIRKHMDAEKRVCLVSPELHQRNHKPFWRKLKGMSVSTSDDLMLCTDFPKEADTFFG